MNENAIAILGGTGDQGLGLALRFAAAGRPVVIGSRKLERAEEAAREMGLDFELVKVTKIQDIMTYGVMLTPALAVDGDVKVVGKVPSVREIKTMLE